MTSRKLNILLAISVAINLFAVAAGVTVWAAVKRHDARVAEAPPNGGRGPLREVLQGLDPAVRERVKASLKASAWPPVPTSRPVAPRVAAQFNWPPRRRWTRRR